MAQWRAQIVGDGITKGFQFLVGRLQLCRALGNALFQLFVEEVDLILRAFALRYVANVALDRVVIAGMIHVGDKLHGNPATVLGFQRKVLGEDIPLFVQLLKIGLVGDNVLERTKFPDGCADQFTAGKAEHFYQEGVHITDPACVRFQNQNAVLCRFK